uniref:Iota-conotoxin-like R11.16 n=1 Tax=Conus radiatus TaxID=61198 RepID=I1BG_CONRA
GHVPCGKDGRKCGYHTHCCNCCLSGICKPSTSLIGCSTSSFT